MRVHQRKIERTKPHLVRGDDGRLRPAIDGSDIGDIWAEQRRIRLAEAIKADQLKAEKAARRKEKLHQLFTGKQHRSAAPKRPAAGTGVAAKAVEISISIPSFSAVHAPVAAAVKKAKKLLAKVPKKQALLAAGVAAVVIVAYGGLHVHLGKAKKTAGKQPTGATAVAGITTGTPSYTTLLPAGKTIGQLGGWGRVSPPGTDPVYAYADAIGSVRIDVSEQPLPDSFKENTAEQITQLAQQYSATEKLTVGDTTVYVGTSAKGPQSLIFTKSDLLILIKSTTAITNDQWASYISTLQ